MWLCYLIDIESHFFSTSSLHCKNGKTNVESSDEVKEVKSESVNGFRNRRCRLTISVYLLSATQYKREIVILN